jgi:AcrR family transcriptional regulator
VQARARATRHNLLSHTAAALAECGYAGTTTQEVCRRAQVSRGTLQYHFPTRTDLLVGALDFVLTSAVDSFVAEAARDGLTAADLVPRMWTHWQGPALTAWLELAVASRTEPELRAPMQEVMAAFDQRIHATFAHLFGDEAIAQQHRRSAPLLLFAILNGLSVSRAYEAPGQSDDILALTQQLSMSFLGSPS